MEEAKGHIAMAKEFEKKAKNKLDGRRIFSSKESKRKQAAKLFHEAAQHYGLAKAWDKAGETLVKSTNCYSEIKAQFGPAGTLRLSVPLSS